MKQVVFFLLLVTQFVGYSQKVTFDTSYISSNNGKFVRYSEVRYEDGRVVTEQAPMDSTEISRVYERDILTLAAQVSEKNIQALERKQASALIHAKSKKIKEVSGADILDSVGYPIFQKLQTVEWKMTGIDTNAIDVDLKRNAANFVISIKGKNFKTTIYNESWIQIQDLYGKGVDCDLFLWRGVYMSADMRLALVAKSLKGEKATKAVLKAPSSTKTKTGTVSRRKTTRE